MTPLSGDSPNFCLMAQCLADSNNYFYRLQKMTQGGKESFLILSTFMPQFTNDRIKLPQITEKAEKTIVESI